MNLTVYLIYMKNCAEVMVVTSIFLEDVFRWQQHHT
jgi:hypothetical protein